MHFENFTRKRLHGQMLYSGIHTNDLAIMINYVLSVKNTS